ncbi:hypothetical protein G5B88_03255 [Herbaspirillum seropedicae]|uniref:hypothetical protein n=1 Tax=Herbaspirillum seropedicae TaxID=964 RepID=UPI0003118ADE|nr:hypothetical protein [Herbaspirillum seropedicae]UMU20251.1 hypothetical protein G5B88_03255 [Herbaspirillum seropedicae]
MDGLDQITLILLFILVVVALLFPLSEGRSLHRDRDRQNPGQETDEQAHKRR